MTIRRLTEADAELIRSTMTHPRVWPWISDDDSVRREDFQPVFAETIIYLGVWSEAFIGLWMCVRQNAITFAVHTCLLPAGAGPVGQIAACEAQKWMWDNADGCQRLITSVPSDNTLALRFAKNVGMVEFGRNPRSFLRNGLVLDEIWLGLSRPESGVI